MLSDGFIGLAYFSIPVAITYFVSHRSDVQFGWYSGPLRYSSGHAAPRISFPSGHCGIPDYGTEGVIKAVTAVASIVTAVGLWPLLPKALALPSYEQLSSANSALNIQID